MPGCVLHVAGTEFDPDAFLQTSSLRPYSVWHRGEPVSRKGSGASRTFQASGFSCDVSKIYGDLRGQITDAVQFLSTHRADFERLAVLDTVRDCRLDFGYDCRLDEDIFVQGEYLPVEFLALVGQLRVAVALSLYTAQTPELPSDIEWTH